MKKKNIDILGMIIIISTIVIFNLIIGANEKGLRILPMSIILTAIIFYLILKKILFHQNIVIKNKVDVFALLFFTSTTLPLIFKSYCTFQGTIEFILKYFFVYAIYLLIRNTVDNKKRVNIVILTTLISSLIIVILGIDLQHNRYFENIFERLNLLYTPDTRFSSTFGYANTVAIYFSFCIFLALGQIKNSNKKVIKFLCLLYILIAFYVVYKTISRTVFILLTATLIIYAIICYYKKILEYSKNLSKKVKILVPIIIFISISIIIFLLSTSKPYEITTKEFRRAFNYNFKQNIEYKVTLEIESETSYDDKSFKISLNETNKYFQTKAIETKSIGNYNGKVELTFTPSESFYRIKLIIDNPRNQKITINKCFINDKEYILKYKYLPSNISEILTRISLNDESIQQRLDFWQTAIKISKDSLVIGHGGNAWKKLSTTAQDYYYIVKETHSYFFELLISYGIVGVTLFLVFIIAFVITIIKNIKQKDNLKFKLPIFIGLLLLITHSLAFDFNMSFLVILITVFGYIALLMYDDVDDKKINDHKYLDYIITLCLMSVLSVYILSDIAQYCTDDIEVQHRLLFYNADCKNFYIKHIDTKQHYVYYLDTLQKFMDKEPYYNQNDIYRNYWKVLLENKSNLTENEFIDYISFIENKYKTVKIDNLMHVDLVLKRAEIMKDAILKLKNINLENKSLSKKINSLKTIMKKEYKINIPNIKAKEVNGLSQETIDILIERYDKMMTEIDA